MWNHEQFRYHGRGNVDRSNRAVFQEIAFLRPADGFACFGFVTTGGADPRETHLGRADRRNQFEAETGLSAEWLDMNTRDHTARREWP